MVALSGTTRDGHRWQLAPALATLIAEVDARHPDRSIRSDGSIASAAHSVQNPTSDHEADRSDGLVKALDLTDDPPRFDPDDMLDGVIARRDPRVKYIIKDRQIWRSYKWHAGHPEPWTPEPYRGSNPHTSHAHISVTDEGATDARSWFPTLEGLMAININAHKLVDDIYNDAGRDGTDEWREQIWPFQIATADDPGAKVNELRRKLGLKEWPRG